MPSYQRSFQSSAAPRGGCETPAMASYQLESSFLSSATWPIGRELLACASARHDCFTASGWARRLPLPNIHRSTRETTGDCSHGVMPRPLLRGCHRGDPTPRKRTPTQSVAIRGTYETHLDGEIRHLFPDMRWPRGLKGGNGVTADVKPNSLASQRVRWRGRSCAGRG